MVATGPALADLRALAKVRRIDNDHVFPGHVNGQPINLRAPFLAALKAAKVNNCLWHDLRYSVASELAISGVTLAEIAEAMGHKAIANGEALRPHDGTAYRARCGANE